MPISGKKPLSSHALGGADKSARAAINKAWLDDLIMAYSVDLIVNWLPGRLAAAKRFMQLRGRISATVKLGHS